MIQPPAGFLWIGWASARLSQTCDSISNPNRKLSGGASLTFAMRCMAEASYNGWHFNKSKPV
ncbi:MAG: hypothetical protein LBP63_07740 [Prevotellaceae bacterium]|nr:hypothetical protein [Prevotellaceae bacterium]